MIAAFFSMSILVLMTEASMASPEAAWRDWIAKGEAAYATERLATLKIDDAIYLRAGQRAWLVCEASCAWKLVAPERDAPLVVYDGASALWQWGGASRDLLHEKDPLAVSDSIDVIGRNVQMAPGETGLRLAVYNQANPQPATFKGFDFFPYNPSLVITAQFRPEASFVAEDFQTSRGWYKRFYRVGHAMFDYGGGTTELPLYASTDDPAQVKEVSAFFNDATTGSETYGVGRYLDVKIEGFPPETVILDFNYAYNPACARSPHFNCPITEVTLPFAVKAGELKPQKDGD